MYAVQKIGPTSIETFDRFTQLAQNGLGTAVFDHQATHPMFRSISTQAARFVFCSMYCLFCTSQSQSFEGMTQF